MNRLLKIGFEYVGHWTLDDSKQLSLTLNSNHNSKNLLYSYISNGKVMYIGKTTQTLQTRLHGYLNPTTSQSTNIRVNGNIIEHLNNDNPIDIFILNDNGLLKFGDFTINIAAGLEDSLISGINPEWNSVGKTKVKNIKPKINSPLPTLSANKEIKLNTSFGVKIGQTYFQQGFFNVPKTFSHHFAEDNSVIEIVLGEEKKQIHGHINRQANKNNAPRIMGGIALRMWIQETFKMNDILNILIISPVSIELSKG